MITVQSLQGNTNDVLDHARNELTAYLNRMDARGLIVRLGVDDSLAPDEICIKSSEKHAEVFGGSPMAALHAVYTLLGHMGCVFTFSGPLVPSEKITRFPLLDIRERPRIKYRGIRMHLNFVQDQSFFTEPAFVDFIDNIARMRFNGLVFHMYTQQQWFPFSYRGVKHLDLELGNLRRAPIDQTMPGRQAVKTKRFWYPAEFEEIESQEELLQAVYGRFVRMMSHAHSRGIRNTVSIEPESLPPALETMARQGALRGSANGGIVEDWQAGWSGVELPEIDIRNPVVLDINVERVLQCISSFPDLDEMQLISREGVAWQPNAGESYDKELDRLLDKYKVDKDLLDTEGMLEKAVHNEVPEANLRAHPYWTVAPGEDYRATLAGSLRFMELALEIFSDPRVKKLLSERNVEPCIAVYSPNPHTIRLMMPIVAAMMPKGMRFDCLADYGAADIDRNLPSWKPVCGSQRPGVISWLEFDGSMMLCQGWSESLLRSIDTAEGLGIKAMCFNHWRVRALEHNASAAALACWAVDGHAAWHNELSRWFGADALTTVRQALDCLEKATIFAKQKTYNIGFTCDWVIAHSTEPPGYDWKNLVTACALYTKAKEAFGALAKAVPENHPLRSQAVRQAEYLEELCALSALHITAVQHIQNAKLPLIGYKAWPLGKTRAAWPPPEKLRGLLIEAQTALELEKQYVARYAAWVESCDEQGQLVMQWQGIVEPLTDIVRILSEQLDADTAWQMSNDE